MEDKFYSDNKRIPCLYDISVTEPTTSEFSIFISKSDKMEAEKYDLVPLETLNGS